MSNPLRLSKSDIAAITSHVNNQLLRAHTILVAVPFKTEDIYSKALGHANDALEAATTFQRYDLQAKAQLFRGHCLRGMGRWKAAHKAYVRAASVQAWAKEVGGLTGECLAALNGRAQLEPGDRDSGSSSSEEVENESESESEIEGRPDSKEVRFHGDGNDDIDWQGMSFDEDFNFRTVSTTAEIGWCGDELMLRDGTGRIVDIVRSTPELRSMKGKAFVGLR